jgi:hypothetical protein
MTYEELQEILKLRQRTPQGPAPTVDEIIAAIQSQYQPVAAMPMPEATQGAQRFVTNAGSIGPIEQIVEYGRGPVTQSAMTTFAPGEFDINRTSYIPTPSAAQMASMSGDGSSQAVPLSAQQEAVFNFMNTPEGQAYKDAFGKANSNLISSVLPAVVPGVGLYNFFTGKSVNPLSAVKEAKNAWDSAFSAMQADITNYGVSPNAMGPTTSAQAQALVDALASQLSSSESGGYTSDQAGGGWGGNDSGYADGVGGVY